MAEVFYKQLADVAFTLLIQLHSNILVRFCSFCFWPVTHFQSFSLIKRNRKTGKLPEIPGQIHFDQRERTIYSDTHSFIVFQCDRCHFRNKVKCESRADSKEKKRIKQNKIYRGSHSTPIPKAKTKVHAKFNALKMTPVAKKTKAANAQIIITEVKKALSKKNELYESHGEKKKREEKKREKKKEKKVSDSSTSISIPNVQSFSKKSKKNKGAKLSLSKQLEEKEEKKKKKKSEKISSLESFLSSLS